MEPNGVKQSQFGPNEVKQGQTGSNWTKWVQTGPNRAKWGQTGPNGATQVQTGLNSVKQGQPGPNWAKYDKQAQQGANMFTWGNMTICGRSEPNGFNLSPIGLNRLFHISYPAIPDPLSFFPHPLSVTIPFPFSYVIYLFPIVKLQAKSLDQELTLFYPCHNKNKNKLGQHQSQTPISSAFWVQKDFGLKKCWVKKIQFQKNLGPKKVLVPYQNNFRSKKYGFKKLLKVTPQDPL